MRLRRVKQNLYKQLNANPHPLLDYFPRHVAYWGIRSSYDWWLHIETDRFVLLRKIGVLGVNIVRQPNVVYPNDATSNETDDNFRHSFRRTFR